MEVSIVIVNYNTKDLVLECIDSILLSKPKSRFEIIIIDNGSTDGGYEIFLKLAKKDDRLKVIRNEENLGFAKANNQGIKAAASGFVLLLNSDTKVKKGAIDTLLEFAQSADNIGAVASRLLNPDGSLQPSVFRFPTIGRALGAYWFGKKGLLDKYVPDDKSQEVEAAVMASFLITPYALEKVGLLSEKYFMYFEDLDYCRRIKEKGLKVYYLPSSQVEHIHGASGGVNKQLVESSKKYHGFLGYYIYTFILWSGQKIQKLFS